MYLSHLNYESLSKFKNKHSGCDKFYVHVYKMDIIELLRRF